MYFFCYIITVTCTSKIERNARQSLCKFHNVIHSFTTHIISNEHNITHPYSLAWLCDKFICFYAKINNTVRLNIQQAFIFALHIFCNGISFRCIIVHFSNSIIWSSNSQYTFIGSTIYNTFNCIKRFPTKPF